MATGATGNLVTVAGAYGFGDGPQADANLYSPMGIAVDSNGAVYFADKGNNRVRKVTGGTVSTVAGTGMPGSSGDGGPAVDAQLNQPVGVAVDTNDNIYIADSYNHKIRKIDHSTLQITTFAGSTDAGSSGDNGPATDARLYYPTGVAVDAAGNVYIADSYNQKIRKVDHTTLVISTFAGAGAPGYSGNGGLAASALFDYPQGVAVSADGSTVYVADTQNHQVRKITAGNIYAFAGTHDIGNSGDGDDRLSATLQNPTSVAVYGTFVYIADTGNNRIRKAATTVGGKITAYAGTGAYGFTSDGNPATGAWMNGASGVGVGPTGTVYLSDRDNNMIRMVDGSGNLSTIAGSGTWGSTGDTGAATSARLNNPAGIAVAANGDVYIADRANNKVRKLRASDGKIVTIAGTGVANFDGDGGDAVNASLSAPRGVAVAANGDVYIADTNNNRIRKITASTGKITTVAGKDTDGSSGDDGPATAAELHGPFSVAVASDGSFYIADTWNQRIRKVSGGIITTIAGTGTGGYNDTSIAHLAQVNYPFAVAVDSSNNVYVADTYNHLVRKIVGDTISTVAGNHTGTFVNDGIPATSAGVTAPTGIAFDASNNMYIADTGNYRIRRVTASNGYISTVAGLGAPGYAGENITATSSPITSAYGIGVDAAGNIFYSDESIHRVRRIETAASPVQTSTTTTTTAALVIPRKGGLTGKILATHLGMATPSGARYSITVAKTSKTKCAVKKSKLVSLKTGTCRFTVTVRPTKGATKRKTSTLDTQ